MLLFKGFTSAVNIPSYVYRHGTMLTDVGFSHAVPPVPVVLKILADEASILHWDCGIETFEFRIFPFVVHTCELLPGNTTILSFAGDWPGFGMMMGVISLGY